MMYAVCSMTADVDKLSPAETTLEGHSRSVALTNRNALTYAMACMSGTLASS